MPKFNQLDLGFKYQIGQNVTHKGFLEPTRQPVVPRYTVVSQSLETGPSGPQRFYYLNNSEHQTDKQIRAAEANLALIPSEEE